LGNMPLQRGPEGRMVILAPIEATADISLSPRGSSQPQGCYQPAIKFRLLHRGLTRPLNRQITGLGHRCGVVAPSLIPTKAGDRMTTNRRDATMLVRLGV
jgi:hypothetical protein